MKHEAWARHGYNTPLTQTYPHAFAFPHTLPC